MVLRLPNVSFNAFHLVFHQKPIYRRINGKKHTKNLILRKVYRCVFAEIDVIDEGACQPSSKHHLAKYYTQVIDPLSLKNLLNASSSHESILENNISFIFLENTRTNNAFTCTAVILYMIAM